MAFPLFSARFFSSGLFDPVRPCHRLFMGRSGDFSLRRSSSEAFNSVHFLSTPGLAGRSETLRVYRFLPSLSFPSPRGVYPCESGDALSCAWPGLLLLPNTLIDVPSQPPSLSFLGAPRDTSFIPRRSALRFFFYLYPRFDRQIR